LSKRRSFRADLGKKVEGNCLILQADTIKVKDKMKGRSILKGEKNVPTRGEKCGRNKKDY